MNDKVKFEILTSVTMKNLHVVHYWYINIREALAVSIFRVEEALYYPEHTVIINLLASEFYI
jgi:hypothetical protein